MRLRIAQNIPDEPNLDTEDLATSVGARYIPISFNINVTLTVIF